MVHSTFKTNKYVGIAGPKVGDGIQSKISKSSESSKSSFYNYLFTFVFGTDAHTNSALNSKRNSNTYFDEYLRSNNDNSVVGGSDMPVYSRGIYRRINNATSTKSVSSRSSSDPYDSNDSYTRLSIDDM